MNDELNLNNNAILRRIIESVEQDKILPALSTALVYAQMTRNEEAKTYFSGLLKNTVFYRSTALIDRLKSENDTAVEYLDADKENDVYAFREWEEKNLLTIKIYLLGFVAEAMREENKDLLEALFE